MLAEIFGRDICNVEENKDIYYTCALTELIHNGSLMHDDLEDQSLSRRGQPCTYIKFGVDYAVNTATFLFYAPLV